MSAFRKMQTDITDQRALVDGLKKLNYTPVVAPGQTVRGDRSYDNKAGYDIVLKKEQTKLRGDIGFRKTKDGSFEVGFDSYIIRDFTQEDFVKKVRKSYTQAKIHRQMDALGLEILGKQTLPNGKVRVQYQQRG